MTLCAAYTHPTEVRVTYEYKEDKERAHDQKVNRTNALAMTQEILISGMIKKQYKKALEAFDDIVENTKEIIRPEESEPRKMKQKLHYSLNYKRL